MELIKIKLWASICIKTVCYTAMSARCACIYMWVVGVFSQHALIWDRQVC